MEHEKNIEMILNKRLAGGGDHVTQTRHQYSKSMIDPTGKQ